MKMVNSQKDQIESATENIIYLYKQNIENGGYEYNEMEKKWWVRNQSSFSVFRNFLNAFYQIMHLNSTLFYSIQNYSNIGQTYTLIVKTNQDVNDITIQKITSEGYLFLSKAIELNSSNYELYFDRLKIMLLGSRGFIFTVMDAYKQIKKEIIDEYDANDIVFNMRYADYLNIPTHIRTEMVRNLKLQEFMLMSNLPETTARNIANLGQDSHNVVCEFLLDGLK